MIASHDTYTYSQPINQIFKLFTGIWKTQNNTIFKQYTLNDVRYFDIRVCRDKNKWRLCHGLVKFIYTYDSLEELCTDIKYMFPEAYFRIVLEKGSKKDVELFKNEASKLGRFSNLDEIIIKKDWKYLKYGQFKCIDYTCKLNTFKEIVSMIKYGLSIKKWAKKHNPKITEEMISDQRTVYFYDFINL